MKTIALTLLLLLGVGVAVNNIGEINKYITDWIIDNQSKICWNDSDGQGMTFSKLSV